MTPAAPSLMPLAAMARGATGFGLAVVAALLAGCASSSPVIVSTPVAAGQPAGEGLVYALPKAQVRVTVQRRQIDAEEVAAAQKAAADAKSAFDAAQKKLGEAKSSLKDASDAVAQAEGTGKDDLLRQQSVAQAWLRVLTVRLAAAKAHAEATAQDRDLLAGHVGRWADSATVVFLPHVPDPSARYVARHEVGLARADTVKIGVKDGLLNSSNVTAVDQTSTIVLNLVQAVAAKGASGRQIMAAPVAESLGDKAKASPTCTRFEYAATFDPSHAGEVARVGSALKKTSGKDFVLAVGDGQHKIESPTSTGPTAATTAYGGYYYRVPKSVQVSVKPGGTRSVCAEAKASVLVQASALVADSSATFRLPVNARAFVKSTVDIVFKDGMPSELTIDSPSQLAAISSLPLAIAKAIIEVPTSIIKLRVDYDNQALAQTEAKVKLLKAQLDLRAAQEALDESAP